MHACCARREQRPAMVMVQKVHSFLGGGARRPDLHSLHAPELRADTSCSMHAALFAFHSMPACWALHLRFRLALLHAAVWRIDTAG